MISLHSVARLTIIGSQLFLHIAPLHHDYTGFYRAALPQGWFALTTVYSFTGLAILASIVFSLLLFLSIDENP